MPAGSEKNGDRSDLALLEAAGAGERRAFDELVARHSAAVFRFARAITDSEANAEEVLQQTFISAWRSAATFGATGTVRSWLFAIARNAAHRLHRRRVGEPKQHDELAKLGCDAGWGQRLAPLAETIATREWVTQALERLPVSDRELLLLIDVEGHTVIEAASIVECSVAAAKSRLHRARLRLVEALRREERA